jgi:predicted heme/steroid binding protein
MDNTKKKLLIIGLIAFIAFTLTFSISLILFRNTAKVAITTDNSLPEMNLAELAKYDGTIESVPIYLALNGLVYDVSPGREFYREGGPYHYLAGKDSSSELNLIGGDIIVRKYKPIARLED